MENIKKYADVVFAIPSADPTPYILAAIPPDIESGVYIRGDDMCNFPSRHAVERLLDVSTTTPPTSKWSSLSYCSHYFLFYILSPLISDSICSVYWRCKQYYVACQTIGTTKAKPKPKPTINSATTSIRVLLPLSTTTNILVVFVCSYLLSCYICNFSLYIVLSVAQQILSIHIILPFHRFPQ